MPPTIQFEHVFGLGGQCVVRHQTLRHMFYRFQPNACADEFHQYYIGKSSRIRLPSQIFDWQITPASAVMDYFSKNFEGVFELDDLLIDDTQTGTQDVQEGNQIRHRILETLHPHQFPHTAVYTRDALQQFYPEARQKFEFLSRRARRTLSSDGPILFVWENGQAEQSIRELVDLISKHRSGKPFHVAVVVDNEKESHIDFGPHVTIHSFKTHGNLIDNSWWKGVDEQWEKMFNLYDLEQADIHAQRSNQSVDLTDPGAL